MIFLQLFLSFLKVGAVSFGGGYGMISILQDEVTTRGWMTSEAFLDFIAVAESTPGPIAINMATFVGASQGGLLGAFLSTLGVVLPAFVIMLLIVAVISNLMKYRGVQAFLSGVRPCVVGLIFAVALTTLCQVTFGTATLGGEIVFDYKAVIILALIVGVALTCKALRKKPVPPIVLILFSACLGGVLYALPV